ncbi:molybdopterin molybdotransferase MoeA [Alteromonas pelagimontana]|uniref:Molybdopterin molybdenumtransferase n=1 Tax=Alteromonas pelagimontana TaxID=1858656 RepID=A0A6M4M837_9ALTE|nr:gephyrin-like molybdotransferase Glp [Alteromonas pelagimontana]QJR79391.1 molybdopterin molybdotransferase MoeA [Alteromonas pelagimontana]
MVLQSSSAWLPLSEAVNRILQAAPAVSSAESIALEDALGRVVANDITAPVNVPPWDNSAMDGYAVKSGNAVAEGKLTITGTLTAGMDPAPFTVADGEAIRIMTGAPIPAGADAVVIQEDTHRAGDCLTVLQSASVGDNIRRCGSDIVKGETVIERGTRIEASHIMLLASLGLAHLHVTPKVKVGVVATGDELVAPGGSLSNGQIFESNRAGICSLLAPFQVLITDYGIVKDDPAALKSIFTRAAEKEDILISSGGVSVGDADFVKAIVGELGSIDFWKIAIKPGKPFAFGTLGRCLFCGVPGNPVSAFVTTQKLVMPLIRKLQGEQLPNTSSQLTLHAILQKEVVRRPGREDFQRATMFTDNNNQLCVKPLPKQSSGVMTSMTQANCFLVIPAQQGNLAVGDTVIIQPFSVTGNWTPP